MMRGGGSIVALGLVACSGATGELPSELGDCAEGTELVWADAQAVLGAHCTRCHAEGLAEGTGKGHPALGVQGEGGGVCFLHHKNQYTP